MPLPRFWYLPRGEKAVVVMSGDDHSPGQAPGGTACDFDRFKALSPAGCDVAQWECVRSTSYIYPNSILTNAQAAAYVADGFEVALHPSSGPARPRRLARPALPRSSTPSSPRWSAKYTSIPAPVSSRTHCVCWPDWSSKPMSSWPTGCGLDANYYHYPRPGSARSPGS